MVENIKSFNRNVIYIREYDPYDKNIREYMNRRGSVVDVILNQETFGEFYIKLMWVECILLQMKMVIFV